MTTFGVASALLIAACGVPTQRDARRVADGDVPFGLASTSTTGAPTTAAPAGVDLTVYYVKGDRLIARQRSSQRLALEPLLLALTAGPTKEEMAAGVRTALVERALSGATLRGRVAVIDLTTDFAAAAPAEQRLAIAQITYTVTGITMVERVSFRLGGEPISVPRGDGSTSDGTVTRADYANLAPTELSAAQEPAERR